MAYYTQVLQPGETVRIVGTLHWLVFRRAIGLAIATIVVLVLAARLQDAGQSHVAFIVAEILAAATLLVFIGEAIHRHSTEIVVTDHRIIYKRGLISRHTVEMNISKIETVDVDQNVWGRLLGYGTVLVKGTGESIEPLRHVADPLKIRNAITIG